MNERTEGVKGGRKGQHKDEVVNEVEWIKKGGREER